MDAKLISRFWQYVFKTDSCWLWTASRKRNGYGQLGYNKSKIYPHRLSYMIHIGNIPDGKVVCHACDVPHCVNPSHLFLGTQQDNLKDMRVKNRHVRGSMFGSSKLADKDVRDIIMKYKSGVKNMTLAREYKVSHATIHRIVNRKLWKHIITDL